MRRASQRSPDSSSLASVAGGLIDLGTLTSMQTAQEQPMDDRGELDISLCHLTQLVVVVVVVVVVVT